MTRHRTAFLKTLSSVRSKQSLPWKRSNTLSAQVAITNYCRMGGLNDIVLKAGKS